MNRLFSILTLLFCSTTALVFASCQAIAPSQTNTPHSGFANKPANDRAQAIKAQPAPAKTAVKSIAVKDASKNLLKTHQIEVTKTLLETASVGGEASYRIQIKALEDIGTVRVSETIPKGIKFESAKPSASVAGNNVAWTFASMNRGQTESIDVIVTPVSEGDHQICSIVSVGNSLCLNLFSGQPKLTVEKQGPQNVELGRIATWRVTVANEGTAAATNVVITDNLPDAFEPTTRLRHTIDTLPAGEERTVEYSAKAVTQGEFENNAVATYEGGPANPARSKVPVRVVQSGLRIRKVGPEEAYVFKPEVFKITIENTGDTVLKNVRITDILPKGSSVADNGLGRVTGNAIGWMIPTLPVGSSQLITTEIAATRKGESTNTVKVITKSGIQGSDSITTNWLAVPGVTVSITDNKDPIRIKERTTYEIQVNNQGQFEPVSGTVTVTFNDSIKPIAVTGDAQGAINGQTVTFPRTTLEPGKDIYLSVIAEGAKIGPGRIVMNFSADFLTDPIISQETTNVY